MFHIVASAMWVFVAWKWGDWRNWRKYHATILYLIASDLLYAYLTAGYPLWKYTPTVLPNHAVTNLLIMFVIYPCGLLVYLPHYPDGRAKQILYVLAWAALWSVIEWILTVLHLMVYFHGWGLWSSILFNLITFPMIRLHYIKPLRAYGASAVIILILLQIFHVPVTSAL